MTEIRIGIILIAALALIEPAQAASDKICWTEIDSDRIQRADLDGSGIEDVVAGNGLDRPNSI